MAFKFNPFTGKFDQVDETTIAKTGETALSGDVTLTGGANVTLTQVGQDIEIASSGGGGGSGTMNTVKSDGSQVGGSDIITLDFSDQFGVTESPDTEINLTVEEGVLNLQDPTDGSWTDGLFAWVSNSTKIMDALDDVNELLTSLAPPPAPNLDDIDVDTNGANGKICWGTGQPIAEGSYTVVTGIGSRPAVGVDGDFDDSGDRAGIINASTDVTGTLNEDVPTGSGSPTPAYPANAFGSADTGNLELELNGVVVRTIDLSTAGAVNDGTSTSGFNISDKTLVSFPNGDPLAGFFYRTGTYRIDSSDMNLGWNYARVLHNGSETNYVDWVVDGNAVNISFSGENLDNLVMTGSKHLSGVEYYTGGTAEYDCTINAAYRNTYDDTNAVTFTDTNLSTLSSENLTASSGNELSTYVITNKSVTINATRLIGDSITVRTTCSHPVKSSQNSSTESITNILLDNASSSSTDDTLEDFNDESRRLHEGSDFDDESLTPNWDETQTLVDSGSANYNDSLQVAEGELTYPSDDWNYTNGPASNPDYSTGVTGERVFYRYLRKSSGASANFRINLDGSGTFIAESDTLTTNSNDIKMSIKMPNGDGDGTGWLDTYEDFATDSWADGDGCRDTSGGNSGRNFNNWDLTVGTRNVANTDGKIWLRITVPQGWTGSITNFTWSFN